MIMRISLLITILAVALGIGATIPAQQKSCPGAPPLRLSVGGQGRLSTSPSDESTIAVRLRETPGKSGRIVGQVDAGMAFKVVSGPQCKDNYAWWQVVSEGTLGWLAEGDNESYFVEPLNISPTLTLSDATADTRPTATLPPITLPPPSSGFAAFNPGTVDLQGAILPYQVASDFNNVVLSQILSPQQLDYLQRNGFVVSPDDAEEFYLVYQQAKNNNQPLLITADSLLHVYHVAFDKTLRDSETQYFLPLLRNLNIGLLIEADKNYQVLKGTDWEDAARKTVAFVGVSTKLIDPAAEVPDYASNLVASEIANINGAAGIGPSAVFPELESGEDWSQYLPRGHYTLRDDLKAYFRAMLYYGRMTFRPSKPEETKSALLLAVALRSANVNGKPGAEAWRNLYEPTAFFVGQSDSPTILQYLPLVDQMYGAEANVRTIQAKGIDIFIGAAKQLPAPHILSTVVSGSTAIADETRGLRFMGQRFVWDAYAIDQLIYSNVGSDNKPRGLPMGLDIPAAIGSDRALQILDKEGATAFDNYQNQMNKIRTEYKSLSESDLAGTLYGAWLYTGNTLSQPVPSGYPGFMTNQPYADRSLYATLGSFAELKHDTILYAEQPYAGAGASAPSKKSPPPEAVHPLNYVEPVPLFWARLAALAEMTDTGLASRGLISGEDAATLKRIAELARRFQDYSIKELKSQALSDEEQALLSAYGDDLAQLTRAQSTALIADIATDPTRGRALEIGTGPVFDMYAAVPINGKLYLAHGAVYSYYEFSLPLADRLTDDGWKELLASNKAPALPDWTFSFIAKDTADPSMWTAIRNFQLLLRDDLWYSPRYTYSQARTSSAAADRFLASQLEPLAKAQQYEGRQLIEINFRGLKTSASDKNTVLIALRETWRGELHNSGPDENSDGPKIGVRGPYSLGVTYTLIKDSEGAWVVSDVSINGTLPNWTNTIQ